LQTAEIAATGFIAAIFVGINASCCRIAPPVTGARIMSIDRHFSQSYQEARDKFTAAVKHARAPLFSFENPHASGPRGEVLATDVALFGPETARNLLVLISGTHGIEGFCGSGCQVALIERVRFASLPVSTVVLVIHALDPYGFAWLRRANEDNVDVNRNAIDHQAPPATPPDYLRLHSHLLPADWDGPARFAADAALGVFVAEHGERALYQAMTLGQYSCPDGFAYGGNAIAWSTRTFLDIMTRWGADKKHIALLDVHSGFGVEGEGERIVVGNDPGAAQRARRWFGPRLHATIGGVPASPHVSGPLLGAVSSVVSASAELTPLVLEFGTVPLSQALATWRAEQWHYLNGRHDASADPSQDPVKRALRDSFYVDTRQWRSQVVHRTEETLTQLLGGLSL